MKGGRGRGMERGIDGGGRYIDRKVRLKAICNINMALFISNDTIDIYNICKDDGSLATVL